MKRPIALAIARFLPTLLLMLPCDAQGQQETHEGFTHPRYDIMVAATEIGRIEEVMVEEGDLVTAGDTIAKLEDAIQAASVRIAEMQAKMRGEIEAAEAEVELYESHLAPLRKLASENMARPDELLRAQADLQVANARLTAAIEQSELRALELERYKLQLDRRKVRAPMAGVISQVFRQPGEYITPADPAVVQLLVTDQLYAVFNIPVEDALNVQVGDPASVYLRSQSSTIATKVHSVSPSIEGESGTLAIRTILPNADGKLRSGDRCTLQFATSQRRSANLPQLPAVTPPADIKGPRRLPAPVAKGVQLR